MRDRGSRDKCVSTGDASEKRNQPDRDFASEIARAEFSDGQTQARGVRAALIFVGSRSLLPTPAR